MITIGVPQWSVLGPLVLAFLLVTKPLLNDFANYNTFEAFDSNRENNIISLWTLKLLICCWRRNYNFKIQVIVNDIQFFNSSSK